MSKPKLYYSISERKILLRLLDVVFAIEGLAILSYIFDFHYFNKGSGSIFLWVGTLIVYILFFGEIFEMYNLKVANERYLSFRSTLLTGLFTTIFYIFTPYISPELPENRIQILYLFLSLTGSIYLWRLIYIKFIFSPVFFKKILLIGSNGVVASLMEMIKEKAPDNFIAGYISPDVIAKQKAEHYEMDEHRIEHLVKVNQVSEIVVETFNNENMSTVITPQLIQLFEKGYKISSSDNFKEKITKRIPEARLNDSFYNYLSINKTQEDRLYNYTHKIFDVLGALLGIIFLIFIIPFVVIANLIWNKGPLFYLQDRVGKGGKVFKIIKLRTMVTNAEKGRAVWAKTNDKRVTKFGKILRKTRLDEIPQFINILRGDMSIIGPRPERPEFVRQLRKEFPFFTTRHVIKPGLTGWAQVKYPYASTRKEQLTKLRYDLYYIKERDLLMDFQILIKTVSTVLFFRGT